MPEQNLDELQNSLTSAEVADLDKPASEPQFSDEKPARPSNEEQLGARLRKLEEANKRLFGELAAVKSQKPSSAVDSTVLERLEVTELVARGYSPEEAKFVLKAGGTDNPFVKAGIESMREKAKVEQAQPSASQVAAPVTGQVTDYKKLSFADRKRNWSDALSKAASRRSGQPI